MKIFVSACKKEDFLNNTQLIITCEHASKSIPEKFSFLFNDHQTLLDSHKGWDPGAIEIVADLFFRYRKQ